MWDFFISFPNPTGYIFLNYSDFFSENSVEGITLGEVFIAPYLLENPIILIVYFSSTTCEYLHCDNQYVLPLHPEFLVSWANASDSCVFESAPMPDKTNNVFWYISFFLLRNMFMPFL